jgi:hypothetical protein
MGRRLPRRRTFGELSRVAWRRRAPERPSVTPGSRVLSTLKSNIRPTVCRVVGLQSHPNAWCVRGSGSDFSVKIMANFARPPKTMADKSACSSTYSDRVASNRVGAGTFGDLAHRRDDSPVQACFPANFSASALTAHGGTNASTLPPSLAISFTILELR